MAYIRKGQTISASDRVNRVPNLVIPVGCEFWVDLDSGADTNFIFQGVGVTNTGVKVPVSYSANASVPTGGYPISMFLPTEYPVYGTLMVLNRTGAEVSFSVRVTDSEYSCWTSSAPDNDAGWLLVSHEVIAGAYTEIKNVVIPPLSELRIGAPMSGLDIYVHGALFDSETLTTTVVSRESGVGWGEWYSTFPMSDTESTALSLIAVNTSAETKTISVFVSASITEGIEHTEFPS
jgi:hypothetical protein